MRDKVFGVVYVKHNECQGMHAILYTELNSKDPLSFNAFYAFLVHPIEKKNQTTCSIKMHVRFITVYMPWNQAMALLSVGLISSFSFHSFLPPSPDD